MSLYDSSSDNDISENTKQLLSLREKNIIFDTENNNIIFNEKRHDLSKIKISLLSGYYHLNADNQIYIIKQNTHKESDVAAHTYSHC